MKRIFPKSDDIPKLSVDDKDNLQQLITPKEILWHLKECKRIEV